MVLSTFGVNRKRSVKRVEKGALRMHLWVRRLRGLCLFGTVLATLGVRALWTRQSMWAHGAVVLLLGLALVQFVAFYRALVTAPA